MSTEIFQCQIDEGQMDDDCCDDGEHGYGRLPVIATPNGPINGKTSKTLISALSNELKDMIQEPLTHSNLNQISRFANIAQELIMVRSPIADVRHRKRPRIGISGPISTSSGDYTDTDSPYYTNSNPVIGGSGYALEENALTGEAAPNETFAAKLVRELIPALTGINKNADVGTVKKGIFEDLVDGIAAAKEKGLDDAAASLQSKLDNILGPSKGDTLELPPSSLEDANESEVTQ